MRPRERKDTLRVGVAGLGMAGGGILNYLRRLQDVEIVAAADPRRNARERFVEEYDGRSYETLAALCEDDEVEAVWIATPTQYHAEHAAVAAERGKHVVVEKPFAVSLEECEAMIDAAARR